MKQCTGRKLSQVEKVSDIKKELFSLADRYARAAMLVEDDENPEVWKISFGVVTDIIVSFGWFDEFESVL